ncbi:hypothetical protein A2Z53_01210 [Candidatus Giovannonibacteria bacterium RIFCSPHIGHO2_02_42_15]|uniref:Uncharacterized protein n=2 Tax=Candidatus Giovannoniibacteriota TaxID=1752738 RepID=A0A1F5VL78_9BACT|nr:MAG: hypothetical protein UV11_C0013G0019 [Candidatus Giovannonibacteria bacterium GW2011_GWF2_42_19]OGF64120.1 MAG: hypothetical protein A2Z53_01210 [Candidatus Giovannonibacteria bacterium RIFCSPHIGHO2_02_42_15]
MATFALLTVWCVWGEESCRKERGIPFDAETPEQALAHLQAEYSFLKGLPWHFSGKDYRLLKLSENEIRVGEEFKMQNASEYGD